MFQCSRARYADISNWIISQPNISNSQYLNLLKSISTFSKEWNISNAQYLNRLVGNNSIIQILARPGYPYLTINLYPNKKTLVVRWGLTRGVIRPGENTGKVHIFLSPILVVENRGSYFKGFFSYDMGWCGKCDRVPWAKQHAERFQKTYQHMFFSK